MNGLRGSRAFWALTGLGLLGSVVIAYAGPRAVGDATVTWWYVPAAPSGRAGSVALLYAGMALLCLAWLGMGRRLTPPGRSSAPGDRRDLLVVGALWALPLALGPPLFSRDMYSYLAQGTILHLGLNPYHATPAVLASLGHAGVLHAVSPFWRHTPAPYGPLFLSLTSAIVAVTGSHLIAGVLVSRALELVGITLVASFLPRLTRALGSDPARATWLIVLSPLTMLELVAAGHNDALMIGLLTAGVALALEGRPMLGLALCALAATIKVPALAGAVFIAIAWARAEDTPTARVRFVLTGTVITAGVLAIVSVGSGLGVSWLSSTVFSTPARVRLAITPATGLGWTVAALLHDAGLGVNARSVESAFGAVAAGATALLGVIALYRVRISKLVPYLGVFLVVAAAGGPAAWPWYFSWGLVLLAACRGPQRSLALALALAGSAFLVKPGGILALPLGSAPAVLAVYALIAGAVWYHRKRGGGDADTGAPRPRSLADGAPSALVRT